MLGLAEALRISGNYTKHDGYLTDATHDDDTMIARAQEDSEQFNVEARFDGRRVGIFSSRLAPRRR